MGSLCSYNQVVTEVVAKVDIVGLTGIPPGKKNKKRYPPRKDVQKKALPPQTERLISIF